MELNDLKKELAARLAERLAGQKMTIQSIVNELFDMECVTEKRTRIALARCYFIEKYNAGTRSKIRTIQAAAEAYSVSDRSVLNAVQEEE
jgi:predicted transcriptional regulator